MGDHGNIVSLGDTYHPGTSLAPDVVFYIHYAYPVSLFFFFLFTLTWWGISTSESSKPTPPPVTGIYDNGKRKKKRQRSGRANSGFFGRIAERFPGGAKAKGKKVADDKLTPLRKAAFNWLLVGVIFTLVANSTNVILHALTKKGWWCGKDYVICTVSLLFIYAIILISQLDNILYPTLPHLASWFFGLVGEVVLLVANIFTYGEKHGPLIGGSGVGVGASKKRFSLHNWDIVDLSIDVLRIVFLVLLVGLYVFLIILSGQESDDSDSEESSSLLASSSSSTVDGVADYGSVPAHRKHGVPEPSTHAPAGWGRRAVVGKQSWWEYVQGYTIFFPYLWPSKDRRLQFLMIICFILMVLQRGINVMVPIQLGKITNILGGSNGELPRLPYVQILLYIVYRFLQGNMGILGAIRSMLWIPIGQYSYQALSTSAFEHVHSLSLDFHLGKKTGEVLSALSKGNAINTFLEQVTFQVVPMLFDLVVAVVYFLVSFDAYYALIVAIVTLCYLYITVRMAQWRADIRREMVNRSRDEDAVKNDSMVAYETVKYFNAEGYEFGRYRDAVRAYQKAEYKVLFSLNIMNVTQNLVFTIGLVVACFLSAWQVSTGETSVGSFVSLLAYLAQLQGPLNFFGTFYRSIQSSMINSERMLELFKEQPTVVDAPHAEKLTKCEGEISFKDVHFSYDARKPALRGLDFVAKPGTTTAFVGESGGGKTTVLRLLFRFYNVEEGSIEVDGKDVRDITIDSLRSHIGVVPQDTVLFNESVMYNLKYANPNATDEMVYEACRAASIHDKIMSFPDRYNTKVGERGLRLSGGEKQRVAIARTILKNPKIILLDEATAALDSETEQHIQAALRELAKGRTTLVIAHRLSTITAANQILCLHEGQVAEAGTHDELLAKNGRYAMMWRKQIRAEQKQKKAAMKKDDESESSTEDTDESLIDLAPSHPSGFPGSGSMLESEAVTPEMIDTPPGELSIMPVIASAQNTAGGGPSTTEIEVTPKTAAAERVVEESPVLSPVASPLASPEPPSRKGKGKNREGLRRSGSALSASVGGSSGGPSPSSHGKWSTRGIKRALSLKDSILHRRSSGFAGSGSPSSSERGSERGSGRSIDNK